MPFVTLWIDSNVENPMRWILIALPFALAACAQSTTEPGTAPGTLADDSDDGGPDDADSNDRPSDDEVPADEGEPTDEDPVDDRPPIETGLLVECASDFVAHDGTHFAVRVEAADDGTSVEVREVTPATSSQPDGSETSTEEIIWADQVPTTLREGFYGFETADMWVVAEATDQPGILRGRMQGESQFADAVEVTCWTDDLPVPARYEDGACVDESGAPARNELPFAYVQRTGFGQCTTLAGELNGDAFGYPVFAGLDLRGADLREAKLHFAAIVDARFEGADLSSFEFGYATVSGSVDEHSTVPDATFCDAATDGDRYECTR